MKSNEQPFCASCESLLALDLEARDSESVSPRHRIQDFESKMLSRRVRWIGEERPIDRAQGEFGTVLCQQHLAGASADSAASREPRQAE